MSGRRAWTQARQRLGAILGGILSERRARDDDPGDDLLGTLMRYRDGGGAALSDDQVADNVLGVLFAAQDTTASVLTWILKFLHDNPKLLDAVKVSSSPRRAAPTGRETSRPPPFSFPTGRRCSVLI